MKKRPQTPEVTVFHHSVITREDGRVTKHISPDHAFALGEMEQVVSDILEFRHRLRLLGIPTADDYSVRIVDGKVIESTVNCGPDGYVLIRDAQTVEEAREVLRKIIIAFQPVMEQPEILTAPDPHPANWCFDETGTARYIDFQPPHFVTDAGLHLIGFPQPTGDDYAWSIGRYYSRVGLIRMLRFSAVRAGGKAINDTFLSILKSVYPGWLFTELETGLASLLAERVRAGSLNLREAIDQCTVRHIDDVREIAMLIAESLGTEGEAFLTEILRYTRAAFKYPLEERAAGVETAKRRIIEVAGT